MNAIPPCPQNPAHDQAAERTARHLRVCQELIEIGMELARAAADRALQDMAAPPPGTSIPCSAAAAIEQAEERARHRTPDYGRVFTHVTRAVRQTILLEVHLAESREPARQAQTPHGLHTPQPPTHHPAIDDHPARDAVRRETVETLDFGLTAQPQDEAAVESLLQSISEQFGCDLAASGPPDARPQQAEPAPAHPQFGKLKPQHPKFAAGPNTARPPGRRR